MSRFGSVETNNATASRGQLPASVRRLVLEDQARRNDICWSVFSD